MTKFIFDISTSARWSGHPVGIVRVERELARRAKAELGDELAFSVFDPASGAFLIVDSRFVEAILNGHIGISFSSEVVRRPVDKIRRTLRALTLTSPRTYQLVQRMRGRRFTLDEVRAIRNSCSRGPLGTERSLSLLEATTGPAALDRDTVVLSGGLDWEHKSVRTIYRLKQQLGFRYITVVYDLIPIYLPHYVVPFYVTLLTEYFGELIWASDGFLCISETTRIDLLRFLDENGVDKPSKAFPLGSDISDSSKNTPLPVALRSKRFALYVSTIEPRKNHRTVYEAWCHGLLSGTIDPAIDKLVFVGRVGWNVGDLLHELSANPLTSNTIIILENISDDLLKVLYQASSFLVFPSYYEGYGLPLAEAFANKKVCISSGAGALQEIGPTVRIDIDPRDILTWSKTMSDLLNDTERLCQLEARIGDEYQITTWDDSARSFFAAVKEMTCPA